tara:strand:+ start:784 stop:1500 length:717 start_codon:yes stop_codon:yes gene_type:complete
MLLKEGGNIFPDTQRINQADVDPTLKWLENVVLLPLIDSKLGSTGLKSTSGDLDIAVNQEEITKQQLVDRLTKWCMNNGLDPKEWISKTGISVHFKTPIRGNVENGFVQTDLMFGNPEWMKWSLRGSNDQSQFKGVHRHLLMASIAKAKGMKWSANKGLLQRSDNKLISNKPTEIAKLLLGPNGQADDLESVETIWTKIKDLPNEKELTADARAAFEKDKLVLPEMHNINALRRLAGI